MENNKKTYENRSKNSFRKSFFVHHQAAWGLLHPTSGCSTMARRCFNAASGKRSVATCYSVASRGSGWSGFNAASGKRSVATKDCPNDYIELFTGFNAASGKRSVATLCPGSRMNTGLKMRFWTTSTKKHPFGTFFAWTPFRFLVKNWLQPLLLKGSTCPWFVWTTYPRFDPFSRLSNCLLVYTFLLGSSSAW